MSQRTNGETLKEMGWLRLGSACLAAALLVGACAEGQVVVEDDAGVGGGVTVGSAGGTAQGGMGGQGGIGGEGGEELPCGIDCSTISTPQCKVAICNEAAGQCEVVDDDDGTVCDDELFCTVNDQCVAGECVGGPANDCGIDPQVCSKVVCNEDSKSCAETSEADQTPCVSADLCQVNTQCTNGLCIGTVKDCFFSPVPGPCWEATCDPGTGQCLPQPGNFNEACDDPNAPCTVGMTCDTTGNCVGGAPMDCSGLTQGCFNGVCDPAIGQCVQQPVPQGGSCADAADDCNVGICDMNGACQPVVSNEGGTCEDGNACTAGETCTAGVCGGGQMVPQVVYFSEDFADNSAGWTLDNEWAIGPAVASPPTGACGEGDPGMDNTVTADNGVAGVVLGGTAAQTVHPYHWVTSPAVDTSMVPGSLWLGYYRWLNSDYPNFMTNRVEVYDGTTWHTVWQSNGPPIVNDTSWNQFSHDITAYKNTAMQVRFGFEIGSSGVFSCSSWNLDDVTIANVVCP